MTLEVNSEGIRLDSYIASNSDLSRNRVSKLISESKVVVNGKEKNASYKVKIGDIIEVTVDEEVNFETLEPTNIPLDIVYEDEYLMIINKGSGLVVHPAPGHVTDTLVNALIYHSKVSKDGTFRPGIVHRLDKDTSGLMVVAKDIKTMELLSDMIKNKKIERHYLAIVDGVILHETGTIDAPIGRDEVNRQKMVVIAHNSKDAITNFRVLKRFKNNTLIECILETGRTHQIRVHLNYIKHPVSNDPLYGNHKNVTEFGQMLHSKSIRFIHPMTGKELYFEQVPPKEFLDYLNSLESEESDK